MSFIFDIQNHNSNIDLTENLQNDIKKYKTSDKFSGKVKYFECNIKESKQKHSCKCRSTRHAENFQPTQDQQHFVNEILNICHTSNIPTATNLTTRVFVTILTGILNFKILQQCVIRKPRIVDLFLHFDIL